MAHLDWNRARPRKATLSIADENAPSLPHRRFVRPRGPKLSKEQQRALAADAVREFESRKAAEPDTQDTADIEVPW